jgi:hypothetical protein
MVLLQMQLLAQKRRQQHAVTKHIEYTGNGRFESKYLKDKALLKANIRKQLSDLTATVLLQQLVPRSMRDSHWSICITRTITCARLELPC